MKFKIIDISVPIKEGMTVWPKGLAPLFKMISSFNKGDQWTETEVKMNLHSGTHLDSPLHKIKGGSSIDKLRLEEMIGPAFVVHLPKIKVITAQDLDDLNLPKNTARLLFKTFNSNFWKNKEKKFQKKFVGLSPDAASWLVSHKIKLVGNDYLSVAQFDKQPEVHKILLENKIILLEGLNLSSVKAGVYQLICLPMKFMNTEAASARAILIK
ncbi:MAG: cyclase family protein [Candidatus Nealsonbacteria bacterium]|nr:cyclase family protein [Candidatus Nealsonbacteria bacterium]